jgi:tetratricopeptide (TPR) repeat protein
MMSQSTRAGLLSIVVAIFIFIAYWQSVLDPMRHEFEPNMTNVGQAEQQLPIEFSLAAATGFREAVAGMLWVRTDEFFHEGNYDAIVPMVRIITWLDPHNADVYQTGAWHLDYNFTDAAQRSDRRYIPLALALLKEGIANNPTDSTMYADLAFTHYYRKIGDYPNAVLWFQKGQALSATEPRTWDVTAVGHGLAHAYLACGMIPQAIAEWKLCIAAHAANGGNDQHNVIEHAGMIVAEKNLKETELRAKWRPIMEKPPIDVNFDDTLTRVAPMVFMLTGHASFIGSTNFVLETGAHKWGPADGCRVEIRLQDADYQFPKDQTFSLGTGVEKNVTIMQDSVSINKGVFKKRLDMSTDHGGSDPMYSFAAPKYTVTLWFNPGSEMDNPPFVADRIGWKGEGLSDRDPKLIDTSGELPGTDNDHVQGFRMLKKVIYLTRDDIMGQGIKEFH